MSALAHACVCVYIPYTWIWHTYIYIYTYLTYLFWFLTLIQLYTSQLFWNNGTADCGKAAIWKANASAPGGHVSYGIRCSTSYYIAIHWAIVNPSENTAVYSCIGILLIVYRPTHSRQRALFIYPYSKVLRRVTNGVRECIRPQLYSLPKTLFSIYLQWTTVSLKVFQLLSYSAKWSALAC